MGRFTGKPYIWLYFMGTRSFIGRKHLERTMDSWRIMWTDQCLSYLLFLGGNLLGSTISIYQKYLLFDVNIALENICSWMVYLVSTWWGKSMVNTNDYWYGKSMDKHPMNSFLPMDDGFHGCFTLSFRLLKGSSKSRDLRLKRMSEAMLKTSAISATSSFERR